MYLDVTSFQKTRGSLAKVRLKMDLTKARSTNVWIGFDENDLNVGRYHVVHYEGVLDFCQYCKHQGHIVQLCTSKKRDEEKKKRIELEFEKMNSLGGC